jgi:hypothetical protein
MADETMTPEQRLSAVLHLEKPDRIPVAPAINAEANAGLAGLSRAAVYADIQLSFDTCMRVFDEFGGWDTVVSSFLSPDAMQATGLYPMKMRIPGRDLPDDYVFQLVEEEVLVAEDYHAIQELGYDDFYMQDYLWRVAGFTAEDLPGIMEGVAKTGDLYGQELARRALPHVASGFFLHPFFTLSLMRSLVRFTEDLYRRPEIVEKTLQRMVADLIPRELERARQSGIGRVTIVEERASGFYYPPSMFERFWWPHTREFVEAFWSEGIVTIFHLDAPWDKNISYFRQLPRGSYVLQLDSTTDIFAAKQELRGHGILWGDVSAALLSLGRAEDVSAYVKKLIEEVADDGGFILGAGCSVPADCKPENLRALIETGKSYELSKV